MRRFQVKSVVSIAVAFAALAACGSDGGGSVADVVDDTSPVSGDQDATGSDTAASDVIAADDSFAPADTATAADTVAPQDTVVPEDTVVPQDTSPVDTEPGPPPVVAPGCTDGQYDEAFPDDAASITALTNGYSAADYATFIDQVLAARYPIGQYVVAHGLSEYSQQNCVALFSQGSTGTAQQLIGQLSTIVHECGHFLDGARGTFSGNTYVFRPDLAITCDGGDARDRFGNTFARSEITKDEYDAMWPNDFYKDTYLVGQGSEQGFNMVAEEAVQYINSLVTDWTFRDNIGAGYSITARDGILTFLFYIERYLRYARLNDPAVHQFLLDTPCWRDVILTIWGRAWLYLHESEGISSLGIDDAELLAFVLRPELLGEIERVRDAEGCP